ncbi:hypothetical protein AVEN_20539-1 [Araneus ventricosus]|uniref:RNase H type-1 domain-containing protein n=1 Tax=Araneus ventricosus TaxID=182803 RepID=A0A4Y2WNZ3_ARAVE|nr:hypothetical protein AVEN_20539-1 [Araneus ventricosus]
MLYKTVIERMLAYDAEVWCLDPPLHQEARITAIRRLNISLPDTLTTLVPGEVVKEETGWAAHPAECPTEEQISLVDGGVITSGNRIYTDDSKTKKDHATIFPHQPITILVDNQTSVQAAANPGSRNTTAREICKSLITNKHIHISWIKAHVGYDENEEADRLAKEAAESDRDPLSVKASISFLKSIFKKKIMEDWQDEDTGRSTFNILSRVSTQPCYWKREEILFFIRHGPFPSCLKRFNLASTTNCPCGNTNGTPLHYATECILTASFHMTKQAQKHELIWFRNVASNKGSRLKIQRLLHHLIDFQELLQINP